MNPDLERLELRLAEARSLLERVPIRDVRADVRRVLETDTVGPARPNRFRRLGRGGMIALVGTLLVTGAVAARFGLPDLVFKSAAEQGQPIDSRSPIGEGWTFDSEVSVEDAQNLGGPTVIWPPSLGRPDHAYVERIGSATLISLVYSPRPGYPAGGSTGPGILLVEVGGALETLDISKAIPEGGAVETVDIGGVPGYWVTGAFHQFAIDARDGEHLLHQVAGETLVWEFGGVVYRLETRAGKDESIALARELVAESPH